MFNSVMGIDIGIVIFWGRERLMWLFFGVDSIRVGFEGMGRF